MSDNASALAEGFYWMAEKLMWGYEDVARNPEEAFRTYRQAADLGFSDAMIRMGELLEYGKGVAQDPRETLSHYRRATKAGNFLGWGFIGRLASRSPHYAKAEAYWTVFFRALERDPDPRFVAERPGGMIHMYLEGQLRRGLVPQHVDLIRQYRTPLIGHHQHVLEHASDAKLDSLDGVANWISGTL